MPALPLSAQEPGGSGSIFLPSWNFMSLSTGGIDTFLTEQPTYDGRGVVVLVLDTGIDPSIAGLGTTTLGTPKVIDLVDVSGSNVVRFANATVAGGTARADDVPVALTDLDALTPAPVDDAFAVGVIDEAAYKNAGVRDFNGDGESNAAFGVLLYHAADGPRIVIDGDADGSLRGERSIGTYRETRETFLFPQADDAKRSPVTVGASIDAANRTAILHYDMNGHGTHVAGIAAGQGINDEAGFNGVAPGAELISVKFASDADDDLTIAGTMIGAYAYAARLADSLEAVGKPVVVNMSFGIGSAEEGKSVMEWYLDSLLPHHPNLYVVTSAGNEGPGLSTVGLPAAAQSVIAVGALLPQGIGRDAYGAAIDRDIIWDFSSRGGEVDKPDVLAPGTAISTIPRFSFDMRASGTSMASPYAAGVVALLLSAAAQEYPGWVPGQAVIRRLLRSSAIPLDGYALPEQGGGVLNVRRAWEMMRRWKRTGFADDLRDYRISTFNPAFADAEGAAAFWRSAYVPGPEWRQTFTVEIVTPDDEELDADFFRAYTLESTAPWMKPIQKTVYIRGDDRIDVDVVYDREKMKEPGLYSGRIVARRARGTKATAADEIEFELLSTITVPHLFSPEKEYRITMPAQTLDAGESRRFYVALPPGAAGATFTLATPRGGRGVVSGTVVDRFGIAQGYLSRVLGHERTEASTFIAQDEMGSGVVEVVIESDPMEGSGGTAQFTLSAEALLLSLRPEVVSYGETKGLRLTAMNGGTKPVEGKYDYTVKGYARTIVDTIRNGFYRRPITLGAHDGALWVAARFAPEEYMKSTDILIRLVDSSGAVEGSETFGTPEAWVFQPNFLRDGNDRGLFLEIVFGSARPVEEAIPFELVEKHVRPTDYESIGTRDDRTLYPFIPRTMSQELPSLEGGIPDGFHGVGEVRFLLDGDEGKSVPVEFVVPR